MEYETIDDLIEYLSELNDRVHYVAKEVDAVRGWLCVFTRDESRWFVMIIHRTAMGQGLGSQLMRMAMKDESQLNGWVVEVQYYTLGDGKAYRSPVGFYQRLGFEKQDKHFDDGTLKAVRMHWSKA